MFKFSLEPVLEVRQRAEEAAQRKLAGAINALARLEARVNALQERLAAASRQRREMMQTGYDPARAQIHESFAQDMRAQIARAQKEASRAREEVEARRAQLLEAARNRRVLEELKKTELEAYGKKELANERKQNDDIAIFAFARRRAEKHSHLQEA